MRDVLLGVAAAGLAAITLTAPAAAGDSSDNGSGHPRFSEQFDDDFGRDRDRRDRRRHRDDGDVFIGQWPQQGDTGWRSDSFNDWWHDRPDRSFPRWLQSNQNCERLWQSGGVWRC